MNTNNTISTLVGVGLGVVIGGLIWWVVTASLPRVVQADQPQRFVRQSFSKLDEYRYVDVVMDTVTGRCIAIFASTRTYDGSFATSLGEVPCR